MIYLDANVVIRLVEGDAATRSALDARLAPALGVQGSLVTSRLSRLECRCKPLRIGDSATLSRYDLFFAGIELLVVDVGETVIETATELRARLGLKSPDAIHLATALTAGASVFLTGDRSFARCTELPVEIL